MSGTTRHTSGPGGVGWVCVVCSVVFVGGFSGGVTPGPFPNPEAKPACADGTAPGRVWESRSPPAFNLWLLRSWLLMILCGSSAAGAFSRFWGGCRFCGACGAGARVIAVGCRCFRSVCPGSGATTFDRESREPLVHRILDRVWLFVGVHRQGVHRRAFTPGWGPLGWGQVLGSGVPPFR